MTTTLLQAKEALEYLARMTSNPNYPKWISEKCHIALAAIAAVPQEPTEFDVRCPDCFGTGLDRKDNNYGCKPCDGSGFVQRSLYAAPVLPAQADRTRKVLQNVRDCLERVNNDGSETIADTIWYSGHETLFDYIDAELLAAPVLPEAEKNERNAVMKAVVNDALTYGVGVMQIHPEDLFVQEAIYLAAPPVQTGECGSVPEVEPSQSNQGGE